MMLWKTLIAKWGSYASLDKLTTASHVVVIIAGLAGMLFFVLERRDTRDQVRREMALQFVELSYSDDVRTAKQASNAFILANVDQFSKAKQQIDAGQPSNFVPPSDITDAFLMRLEFYDHVLICRELLQCDETLIDSILRDDMCRFNEWLSIILPQLERNFGSGIAKRLQSYCSGAPSKG